MCSGKPRGFAKYQWATIVETSFSGTDTQMVSALASLNSAAGDLTIVHDLPTSASPRAKVLDFAHGVVRAHDTLGQRPDGIHISSCTSESTRNAAGTSELRESERRSAIARGKWKLDCNIDARFSSRRRTQLLPISETGINSSSLDVQGFVSTPHLTQTSHSTTHGTPASIPATTPACIPATTPASIPATYDTTAQQVRPSSHGSSTHNRRAGTRS